MFKLSTSRRFFSAATNRAFYVEKLDKGVVLFKMNRPKARNAISSEFVD
jgi:enoyl-CoA hydratase/carnithine racemase